MSRKRMSHSGADSFTICRPAVNRMKVVFCYGSGFCRIPSGGIVAAIGKACDLLKKELQGRSRLLKHRAQHVRISNTRNGLFAGASHQARTCRRVSRAQTFAVSASDKPGKEFL